MAVAGIQALKGPESLAMSTRGERLTFGHGLLRRVPSTTKTVAELAHEPGPVRLTRLATWDWGWGGLLIFTILLFFRPQEQLAGLPAMHASDLAAVIGLGAMIYLRLRQGESITRVTPELIGLAALTGAMALSVPTSFWPGGSFQELTTFAKVAAIFLLMVNTVTSPRRIERITWVIILALGYVCTRAVFDYSRGVNLVEGDRIRGALGGFFENPNDLALNIVTFLPIGFMYIKRPGPLSKRAVSVIVVLLMCATLVFTKSRSGMIGAAAMMAVVVIVSRILTPQTILAAVIAAMIITPALPPAFWNRMASIADASKDSTGSREERRIVLGRAWEAFLDSPITGVGIGQFKNYRTSEQPVTWRVTHNAFLQVAAEIGVFGLIAFVFLIGRAYQAGLWTRRALAWTHRRWRPRRGKAAAEPEDGLIDEERRFLETHASAMIAGMTGWLVCAFFASVAFHWTFYYMLALSVCARDVVRHRAVAYAEAKRLEKEGHVIA